MALTVTDVCRFTLNQHFMSHTVANIVDMRISPSALGGLARGEAIADQAKVLAHQWTIDVMPDLVNKLTLDSVSWVDLDSEDGSVGVFSGDGDTSLPHAGGVDNDAQPSNVALLVRKSTTATRGAKQGRMYVCGIAEAYTTAADPEQISSGFLATLQGNMDSWLGNINQTGSVTPPIYDSVMVVVHKTPVVGEGNGSEVTALRCDGLLATQRRRLRR